MTGKERVIHPMDPTEPVWEGNQAKIIPAIVKAQAEIGVAVFDSTNPHFKSKYASLSSIWTAIGEALKANGLAALQLPGFDASNTFTHKERKKDGTEIEVELGLVTLHTIIVHESGEQFDAGVAGAPGNGDGAPG